ncbi:MAG TPA: hypothetical protein VIY51_04790 [Xanthobacteraceae bacterium]
MTKQLCLSAIIELPADLFEAAEVVAKIKAPWCELLAGLKAAGVQHAAKSDEMEIRAKAVRRPRKPRLVTPPPDLAA